MENSESQSSRAKAVDWYRTNRPTFEQLSMKLESIIKENLVDLGIHIHSIQNRTKELDSFSKKIEDPKYSDPTTEIQDLSGVRIIAYVESDLEKISDFVQSNFEIDPGNSMDKSKSLGTNMVGYRSIHFVAKLPPSRLALPEYKKFENCCFEIQIRTILQHAWAEIEHDRGYKFSGVLPEHLQRRFGILAGVLELADREFDQIAKEIDQYGNQVTVNTHQGDLQIPLDSTSVRSFLKIRFSKLIEAGLIDDFYSESVEKKVLLELDLFGITTLGELNSIIPEDYQSLWLKTTKSRQGNFNGILRDFMMISDISKYLSDCWDRHWTVIDSESLDLLEFYRPEILKIFKTNGIVLDVDEED